MKKLFIPLFLCLFAVSSFAADAFLGWRCTDKTKMTEALAKSDTDVPPWQKAAYEVNLALLNNQNMTFDEFKTLAKTVCDKYWKPITAENNYTEDFINGKTLQYIWCDCAKIAKNKFGALSYKDPVLKENLYMKTCVCFTDTTGVSGMTDAERRNYIVNYIGYRNPNDVNRSLNKYEELTANDDDDAAVVKELRKMYRIILPKISSNEAYKPCAVRIALMAKARGTEF